MAYPLLGNLAIIKRMYWTQPHLCRILQCRSLKNKYTTRLAIIPTHSQMVGVLMGRVMCNIVRGTLNCRACNGCAIAIRSVFWDATKRIPETLYPSLCQSPIR